jgi:hypothetical protein
VKQDFTVFIGYDSSQDAAAQACRRSIIAQDTTVHVEYIKRSDLLDNGLYWRQDHEYESTEFAFTRFLTPYLKGYYGYALFCDSDFIWRCSPRELLERVDPLDAVTVVKHNISPEQLKDEKMNGKKQVWYPKKNWSSMMLFNCEHPKTRALTPEVVSEAPASYLHGLEWTWDASVGEVDKTYNYLVGYYNDRIDPKVLHYTDGTPLHAGYENCEFAEEFMKYVQPRTE